MVMMHRASIASGCTLVFALANFVCAPARCAQSPAGTPKASPAATPLPAAATLIKIVAGNQHRLEAIRRDYISHRQDQEFDAQGRVKSQDVKEYEVYFIGHWEIERLLSKDGKPLSEGEARKQDADVRKQEAEARKRIAKEESGEDPGKDTITPEKFLAADRFYNLRRETYEGREVYAMDFAPRPEFEPHSMVDRVLKTLGGTVWIDEQAQQIVRLEARLLANFKVGGGLLGSVQKGGNVVLEQRFVNGEVWMPSYDEFHLNARVLFLHKSYNGISTYSDYRKFHVDSKIISAMPPPQNPTPSVPRRK